MNKNRIYISIFIVVAVVVIALIPYMLVFKNQPISAKSEVWGSFGDYLGGVISVVNLIAFVYITLYLTKIDEERSRHEIKTQKLITLTQFRQNELEKLTLELSKPIDNDGTEALNKIVYKSTFASIYLINFFNQKSYLFPILSQSRYLKIQQRMDSLICQLIELVEQNHGKKVDEANNNKMGEILKDYQNLNSD